MSFVALVRRDPAFDNLGRLLLVSVANALVLMGLLATLSMTENVHFNENVKAAAFALILWVGAAIYLTIGRVERRCRDLDLALPLPARRLWLAHLGAVVAGGVVVLALAGGITAIFFRLLSGLPPLAGLTFDAWPVSVHLLGALVLAVAILQSGRPADQDAPGGLRHAARTVAVLLGVGGLMVALIFLPLPFVAVPFAAAALLAGRTWRVVPAAFKVAGTEAAASPEKGAAAGEWTAPLDAPALHRTLLRTLLGTPKIWLMFFFILLYALALGGILEPLKDAHLRFLFIPMMVYMLLSVTPLSMKQLPLVDHFPVRRRTLFAYVALPPLLVTVVGYAAVVLAFGNDLRGKVGYEHYAHQDHYFVTVPWTSWQVTDAPQAPMNRAPWGEAHEAGHGKIWESGRTTVYSPFSTPVESSPRFVAWQISRAMETVYGRTMAPQEIERQLTVRDDGRVVPRDGHLAFLADPALAAVGRVPRAPAILGSVLAAWLFALAIFLRGYRAGVTEKQRMVLIWIFLGLILGGLFAQIALAIADVHDPDMLAAASDVLLAKVGGSTTATALLWIGAFLLVGAAWKTAERSFERIEILPEVRTEGCSL